MDATLTSDFEVSFLESPSLHAALNDIAPLQSQEQEQLHKINQIPIHTQESKTQEGKVYTTPIYDIKNTNTLIEDAIDHFNAKYSKSRSSKSISPGSSFISEDNSKGKIRFGTNKVVTFGLSEKIGLNKQKNLKPSPQLNKRRPSILKSKKQDTPQKDDQYIGNDDILNAIARCFTLCNIPLREFVKDDILVCVDRLSIGISTAFRTKELCYNYIRNNERESSLKKVREIEKKFSCLKKANEQLSLANEELCNKLDDKCHSRDNEVKETEKNLLFAKRKMQELIAMNVNMEKLRLDYTEATLKTESLLDENNRLRKEKDRISSVLETHMSVNKSLQSQIKKMELKLKEAGNIKFDKDRYSLSLERLRNENTELLTKMTFVVVSNKKFFQDNEKLKECNANLRNEIENSTCKLKTFNQTIRTIREKKQHCETLNKKLFDELEISRTHIERLTDSNNEKMKEYQQLQGSLSVLQSKHTKVLRERKMKDGEFYRAKQELQRLSEILRETRISMCKGNNEGKHQKQYERTNENITNNSMGINLIYTPTPANGRDRILRSIANRITLSSTDNMYKNSY